MNRFVAFALALVGFFVVAAPVLAQFYPNRTVTIVVPYAAGGPTDETARVVARFLSDRLKQNFIVENVSGGGTIIATNRVAHAAPDGYTLLLHNLAISANATLYKDLPFDTEKELTPVIFINRNPLVLAGRKTLEPNTLAELVAWMKTHRAKAAIAGYGTTGHLATALFVQEAKLAVDLIPYRGGAPVMSDILGGHVDLFFGTPQQLMPQVVAGKLKAYGVSSKEKSSQLAAIDSFVTMFGWRGVENDSVPLSGIPGNISESEGSRRRARSTSTPSGMPAAIRKCFSRSFSSTEISSSSILILRLCRSCFGPLKRRPNFLVYSKARSTLSVFFSTSRSDQRSASAAY